MKKEPKIDEEKCEVSVSRVSKVLLHHISAIDDSQIEVFLDMGLDYIWKTMHCSIIRVSLHHFTQYDPKTEKDKLMVYD